MNLVPVYVRAGGDVVKGLAELQKLGAKPWPNPKTAQQLETILAAPSVTASPAPEPDATQEPLLTTHRSPADELFAKVTDLLDQMDGLKTIDRVAKELQIPKTLAGTWLKRFVDMKLRKLFESSDTSKTIPEVAKELQITRGQVPIYLKRLLKEGLVDKVRDKQSRRVRYRSLDSISPLFGRGN